MNKNVWFGLVTLEPINGNADLGNAIGAVVNVAYRAFDIDDFLIVVAQSFKSFDFKVIEIEDIENEDNLFIKNPDNAEKLKLLKQILDGDDFAWGTFHTYLHL
jgi:hypothetical protein